MKHVELPSERQQGNRAEVQQGEALLVGRPVLVARGGALLQLLAVGLVVRVEALLVELANQHLRVRVDLQAQRVQQRGVGVAVATRAK